MQVARHRLGHGGRAALQHAHLLDELRVGPRVGGVLVGDQLGDANVQQPRRVPCRPARRPVRGSRAASGESGSGPTTGSASSAVSAVGSATSCRPRRNAWMFASTAVPFSRDGLLDHLGRQRDRAGLERGAQLEDVRELVVVEQLLGEAARVQRHGPRYRVGDGRAHGFRCRVGHAGVGDHRAGRHLGGGHDRGRPAGIGAGEVGRVGRDERVAGQVEVAFAVARSWPRGRSASR